MKLYYMPGACSLAPHIVANEAGLALDIVKVDGATKTTEHGEDFLAINPNGYVPTLQLDDGTILTETQVLVQYLADLAPGAGLIPAAGEMERYKVQQWLALIATEIHKSFGALFKPDTPDAAKEIARAHLLKRLGWIDAQLAERDYLTGSYSVADVYLWVVSGWAKFVGLDTRHLTNLGAFAGRISARPEVLKSLKEEGLI